MSDDDLADEVSRPAGGYRHPPASTRFQRGRSGNPRGRPRGSSRNAPYEAVLGQHVTIREGGTEREVSAAEAFLLHLAKRGLEGDGAAARATTQLIETAKASRPDKNHVPSLIVMASVAPGSVSTALESLSMARKLDPYRSTARMVLEPWLVEAALARFGDRRRSPAEQITIVKATRAPHKVAWPSWWSERP